MLPKCEALLEGRDGTAAAFVVRRMNLDFKKPARIDDVLEVRTHLVHMSSAVLTLEQNVARDTLVLFSARVEIVLVSLEGKPQRLSQRLRNVFSSVS